MINNLLLFIGTLLGGGTLGGLAVALIGKRKSDAEAENTSIKGLLDINQRMNERLVSLEERVAHLEKINYELMAEGLEKDRVINELKYALKLND